MIEMIFEKTYTQYKAKQKLSALSEYLGKIPGSSNKKYVKMLVFGKDVAIYNVKEIQISKSIGEGTAAETPGEKKVHIIYTGDETSKVMTCKGFANQCKQILEALKDVKEEEVVLEAVLEGKDKGASFRLYYDNETDFVILVRNTNEKGVEKFLKDYQGDLLSAISVPKPTKEKKPPKEKKPDMKIRFTPKDKKPNPHEGYTKVDSTDAYGHRVTLWRRNDTLPDDFKQPTL